MLPCIEYFAGHLPHGHPHPSFCYFSNTCILKMVEISTLKPFVFLLLRLTSIECYNLQKVKGHPHSRFILIKYFENG